MLVHSFIVQWDWKYLIKSFYFEYDWEKLQFHYFMNILHLCRYQFFHSAQSLQIIEQSLR